MHSRLLINTSSKTLTLQIMLFPGIDLTGMRIATVINTLSSVEKRANTHPLLYAHRYPVQFCFCLRRSLSDASLPLSLLLVYQYQRLKTTRSILTHYDRSHLSGMGHLLPVSNIECQILSFRVQTFIEKSKNRRKSV